MEAVNLVVRYIKARRLQLRLNRDVVRKIELQEHFNSVPVKRFHHLPEFNLRSVGKSVGALRGKIAPLPEIPVILLHRRLRLRSGCRNLFRDLSGLLALFFAHALRLADNFAQSLRAKLIDRHQLHAVDAELLQIGGLVRKSAEGAARQGARSAGGRKATDMHAVENSLLPAAVLQTPVCGKRVLRERIQAGERRLLPVQADLDQLPGIGIVKGIIVAVIAVAPLLRL